MVDKRIMDYAASFSAYMRSGTNLSPRSRELYSDEFRLFAQNVENPFLADLTPQTLLQWNQMLYDAGAAVATMDIKRKAVKKFLDYLEEFEDSEHAGKLLRSLKRLHAPRDREPPRKPFSLTEEQVAKMLEAAGARLGTGPRDRAIVHLLWATGMRRAELGNLLLDDLDITARLATATGKGSNGKGSKTRTVVYDALCKADLVKWLELRLYWRVRTDEQHVFVSAKGGPLNLAYICELIRTVAQEAGLRKEVWTHLFRHSRITALLNKGMALQDVATFAGHTKIQTTLGYFHQSPGQLKKEYDKATTPRQKGTPARTVGETEAGDESEGN